MSAAAEVRVQVDQGLALALPVVGLGGRSYAFLIDWHIRVLLALVWFAGSLFLVFRMDSASLLLTPRRWELAWVALVWGPAAALYLLYHPVLELLMGGTTPGKRMAGVRILRRDGAPAGPGALILRNLFRLVDSLPVFYLVGMATVALTAQRVRIGDLAAGTVLVYERTRGSGDLSGLPLAGPQGLDQHRLELVHDLLERWMGLRREVRMRLAERLLADIGLPLTPLPGASARAVDKALRARLIALRDLR